MKNTKMGGTDCSLPMRWALENKVPVDCFVILTDCETWAGPIHPTQALKHYREQMGINSKLCVMAMTPNGATIADQQDAGQMDICGFDTNVPQILREFCR